MYRPLIGITAASFIVKGKPYHRGYAPNSGAIAAAGGLPVYVPPGLDDDVLRDLYSRLDGLLLPGGPDVRPDRYGQAQHPMTQVIDDPRDTLEITLAQWAFEDDVPVFGICRGHQVLNVALGGTLVQDIPSIVGDNLTHDISDDTPRSTRMHDVDIDADSRLSGILGTTHVSVNSIHHQSVLEVAPAARVTANAPDGVIEALEVPGKPFMLSVQWHPEDLYSNDPTMARLFESFIAAAREYHERRANPATA
ncbi:MAG: gamma-glutamyl-gamma-aminobutyrate hydrolase family protein [Anaerolineae bacterium]